MSKRKSINAKKRLRKRSPRSRAEGILGPLGHARLMPGARPAQFGGVPFSTFSTITYPGIARYIEVISVIHFRILAKGKILALRALGATPDAVWGGSEPCPAHARIHISYGYHTMYHIISYIIYISYNARQKCHSSCHAVAQARWRIYSLYFFI